MGGHDRTNIRELILDCLMEVLEEGSYSHVVLNNVLNKYAYLPKTDRAFFTIVYEGTLERLITLDYILNKFSKTPVNKMKPVIRNLLRSALYQIIYLDGTPDSVVVNETVKLAGKRGFKGLQGFVNGVLRNISRAKTELPWPDENRDVTEYLSVKYSIPGWIVDKWIGDYGREACEGILKASMEHPETVIRINRPTDPDLLRQQMADKGITMSPTCFDNAYTLSGYDRLTEVPGFDTGAFQIQDISSIRVGNLIEKYAFENTHMSFESDYLTSVSAAEGGLGDKSVICENENKISDKPGFSTSDDPLLRALDLCAAPGGKSLHLRNLGFDVTSCDVSEKKLELIRENFSRVGAFGRKGIETDSDDGNKSFNNDNRILKDADHSNEGDRIHLKVMDGTKYNSEFEEAYDIVLADVPCSGLGVLARKSDIKYRLDENSLIEVALLQSGILENAVKYVRKAGLLAFSTCTINKDENEFHRDMIAETGNMELMYEEQRLPGRDPGDGFYIAIFRKH